LANQQTNYRERLVEMSVPFKMYIRLYVSEMFEINSRSNASYRKTNFCFNSI